MQAQEANLISINGKKLSYEILGQGDAVVFLHAAVSDKHMWDKQWQAFSQQYRCLRYDRPSFGDSEISMEARSDREDLLALLDNLGIEKAHFIACSQGGEIAIDFALEVI